MKPFPIRLLIRIAATVLIGLYLPQRAQSSTWSQSTSPHFLLYTEGKSRQDRHLLRLLERSRSMFLSLGMLNPAREHSTIVFAFKNSESFSYYARPHTAGFFQKGEAADYIGLLDGSFEGVLHEYAHAAIGTVWPSLPVWMKEGLAGYYSTAKWTHQSLRLGGYLWDSGGAFDSLATCPLSSVLDVPDTLIDEDRIASVQRYWLSWALVHMMMTEPLYVHDFREFLDALNSGTPVTDSIQRIYGRTLAQVQGDLSEYLKKGRFATSEYECSDGGESALLEASTNAEDFEVQLKLADLLSHSPLGAPKAMASLRQLSAQHSESLEVEERLAALSWKTGDETGLRAHMKKAYRLGSKDTELLLLDAQSELKSRAPNSQIIPLLERALAESPDNYRARSLLGYVAYQNKDYARALSLLKPIESVEDPNAFVVLGSLAYSAAWARDYSAASMYALRALKKARSDQDRAAMRNLLGWIAQLLPTE